MEQHTPTLDFTEKGKPTVELDICGGCGHCVRICPDEVFVMNEGRPEVTEGSFIGCIACGHCMMVCPTGAVTVSGRGAAPEDRTELPPKDRRATADQFEALLLWRRSVRRFQDREVDRAAIDRILEMTATAPMGIPPHLVGVVVFAGRDKVSAMVDEAAETFGQMAKQLNPLMLGLMRPFIGKESHHAMRAFVQPLLAFLAERHEQGQDVFVYDAPLVLLFHHAPGAEATDVAIATTYAMLAAESLGLGSCMIGSAVALDRDKRFKQRYGIPPKNKICLALAVGHPDVQFKRGVRRRLASVTFA
jgi:nitroreductase/NAD-dependent dihydropyrimidine dehydrogenase PreA subunit